MGTGPNIADKHEQVYLKSVLGKMLFVGSMYFVYHGHKNRNVTCAQLTRFERTAKVRKERYSLAMRSMPTPMQKWSGRRTAMLVLGLSFSGCVGMWCTPYCRVRENCEILSAVDDVEMSVYMQKVLFELL